MGGYAKLFADIVDSSIWTEPNPIRVVWITMLALADGDGYIRGSPGWLASKAHVTLEECTEALRRFQLPDPASRTPDHEGRRIEAVDDGWIVINYLVFRDRLSQDSKSAATRERVRKYRERQALRNAPSVTTPDSASASDSVSASDSTEGGCKGETDFDTFWDAYPKKVGKQAAAKAWKKAKPPLDKCIATIAAFKRCEQWTKEGGQFIPHPSTWINEGRWDDEVPTGIKSPVNGGYDDPDNDPILKHRVNR